MSNSSNFKMLAEEMRNGFAEINTHLASMDIRLSRLEGTVSAGFKVMSDRFEGIGKYLNAIDRNVRSVDIKVNKLEDRNKDAG